MLRVVRRGGLDESTFERLLLLQEVDDVVEAPFVGHAQALALLGALNGADGHDAGQSHPLSVEVGFDDLLRARVVVRLVGVLSELLGRGAVPAGEGDVGVHQGGELPDVTEDASSCADGAVALLVGRGSDTPLEGLLGLAARHCYLCVCVCVCDRCCWCCTGSKRWTLYIYACGPWCEVSQVSDTRCC